MSDRVLARSRPLWNQAHTSGWLDTVLRVAEASLVIAAGGTARLVEAALAAAERRDQVVIVADATGQEHPPLPTLPARSARPDRPRLRCSDHGRNRTHRRI